MARLVDVALATAALVVATPLLALAAVGIRLTSPGPVVYRARRVGQYGRMFMMYKLRTMHVATAGNGRRITARDDERIFPFGRWLRRTKVDELPQLINVLRGDMAIVGPRPEDPDIVAHHYSRAHLDTLRVRPGLASPGSLYAYTHGEALLDGGDPETNYVRRLLDFKLALDLVYVRHASVTRDLTFMARTAATIVAAALGKRRFNDPPEAPEARSLLAALEKERECDAVPF